MNRSDKVVACSLVVMTLLLMPTVLLSQVAVSIYQKSARVGQVGGIEMRCEVDGIFYLLEVMRL